MLGRLLGGVIGPLGEVRKWSRILLRVMVHSQPRNESPVDWRRKGFDPRGDARKVSCITSAASELCRPGLPGPAINQRPVAAGDGLPGERVVLADAGDKAGRRAAGGERVVGGAAHARLVVVAA